MNPHIPRFTVQGVGQFPNHLARLVALATQRGLQTLLADALRQIAENLEFHPREWGDPYINYRGMRAVGYGRTIHHTLLRVEYTVHESEPMVWISALWPLPDSPFAES